VISRLAALRGVESRFPASSALDPGRRFRHTGFVVQKIAVTLDEKSVIDLDRWVQEGRYPNRSRALQSAVDLLAAREKRSRLARELAKLDVRAEKELAEEGLGDESWPEYREARFTGRTSILQEEMNKQG
jgi:Arc/MetJ-type ribon-helix-helix transcriptional regulator